MAVKIPDDEFQQNPEESALVAWGVSPKKRYPPHTYIFNFQSVAPSTL
jgi:hypothetical protein